MTRTDITMSDTAVAFEGDELEIVARYFEDIAEMIRNRSAYRLTIATDAEGVKFKVNNGSWSPGRGTLPGRD